jgi:hypothetical protein
MPCETVRRPLPAACLVAFACATTICLGPSVSWAQTNAEKTVQTAMTKGEDGMYSAYDGHFVKWLPHFGDASAVALTKILADKPITDTDIPAILIVVRDSYDSLISIENAADRKPRTTLFVLSSLSHATTDPETIKKIADTRAYINSQYANYAQAHPTE